MQSLSLLYIRFYLILGGFCIKFNDGIAIDADKENLVQWGLPEGEIEEKSGCRGNCNGFQALQMQSPTGTSKKYAKELATYIPEQPKIKCCDPSCPKCLGGIAPKPGAGGCIQGCPSKGCSGACVCDECACCYTSTKWILSTTTCLDFTTVPVTQLATSTAVKYDNIVKEFTKTITFTVVDQYLFTSYETFLEYATGPHFVSQQYYQLVTKTSTVFAQFSLRRLIVTFTQFVLPSVTATANPGVIEYILYYSTITPQIAKNYVTTITGFSFGPQYVYSTTTVEGTYTYYKYVDVSGTLSLATKTFCGLRWSTINNFSGKSYRSTVTATQHDTILVPFDAGLSATITPTTTVTQW